MKSFEFVDYKGKQIAVVDLANTKVNEINAILTEARNKISQLPQKSALILTDVTNAEYNRASSAAMKEFANNNTPFVKASVVVGIDDLRNVLLQTISMLTGRRIKTCKDRNGAMEWLISQKD